MMEGAGVHAMSAGVGAGVAASANHGRILTNSYEALVQAQQAALAQTKAIQQYMAVGGKQEAQKDWLSAEKSYKYVLQLVAKRDGPGSDKSVPVLQHLVTVNKEQHKLDEAIGYQKTVVAFTSSVSKHNESEALKQQNTLSKLYIDNKQYTAAEPVVRQSYALCTTNPSLPAAERRVTCETYAKILHQLNREEDAKAIEQYLGDSTEPFDVPVKNESSPAQTLSGAPQSAPSQAEMPATVLENTTQSTAPQPDVSSSNAMVNQPIKETAPQLPTTEPEIKVPTPGSVPDQVTTSAPSPVTPPPQSESSSTGAIAKDEKNSSDSSAPMNVNEQQLPPTAPGANQEPPSVNR